MLTVIMDLTIMVIESGALVTGGMVDGGEPGFQGIGDIGAGSDAKFRSSLNPLTPFKEYSNSFPE